MLLCLGYVIDSKKRDADYTKYLGPNYKTTTSRCTTIISNHISFIDMWLYNADRETPSYVAAAFVGTLPLGHIFCVATNCIMIDRGSSKEDLDKAL